MIYVRLMIAAAILTAQETQVTGKPCKLSSGPGNPYPWMMRIWYMKEGVVTSKDSRHAQNSRLHVAQGALITANKVVSPCSAVKNLDESRMFLTGYHFTDKGKYDCHLTQTVFQLWHHPRCNDGNLDADFSLWTLRYPFAVEGKPFLFTVRPTIQDFEEAALEAENNLYRCELPVFPDAALQSQAEIQTNVHFLSLKEYTNVSCTECNCTQVPSTTENVNVVNVKWDVKDAKNGFSVNRIGAVLVCYVPTFPKGFPMGMVGVVSQSRHGLYQEYRYVSSFQNFADSIFPPPKAVRRAKRTTNIGTRKVKTTRNRNGWRRTRITTTIPSPTTPMSTAVEDVTNPTELRDEKMRRRIRKRTTPLYLEDWEALEAFLNNNRKEPSSVQRFRPGDSTKIASVLVILLQFEYLLPPCTY